MKKITTSTEQTIKLGEDLANKLKGGDVILLQGELGAGKTALAKGIARGLGIKEEINSPTFTLMNIYEAEQINSPALVHIDTYRIKNEQEMQAVGVEDYLGNENAICLIEWPEKMQTMLTGKKTIMVNLKHLDKNQREITFS